MLYMIAKKHIKISLEQKRTFILSLLNIVT